MKFFSKKPLKTRSSGNEDEYSGHEPQAPSPTKPSSSHRSSSSRSSPTKKSQRGPSPPPRERQVRQSPRNSRSFARLSSDSSSHPRNKRIDPNIHPLNLPPEERRKLSVLSSMNRGDAMDVEGESPMDGAPHSAAAQPQTQPQTQPNLYFPGVADGNGTADDAADTTASHDHVPTPPPHSSPLRTPAEEAEEFKDEGNRLFKLKEFDRAIESYSKAIVKLPDNATYLGNRAAGHMAIGRYHDALEDCKRAVELDGQNSKMLLRLARIYTSLGHPEEALATFERMQPRPSAKDMASAKEMMQYVRAARAALQDGSASMVLHPLDRAEKLLGAGAAKPRKWQLMRGEALLTIGDSKALAEALTTAMSMLRNNSKDPEALVLRGRVLYGQGENDKAIQHFREALKGDPDYRDAVKWLRIVQKLDRTKEEGNREYKAGRYHAAVDKYTAALLIDPANKDINSKLYQNRALCRTKLRQYDEAVDDCDRALRIEPGYNKARRAKAKALGLAERWEEAVREWKAAAELEPEDRELLRDLKRAELELKKAQRKDYYKILGLNKSADENQIKKAYRKLAIVHHPDKNPGDSKAEARFKDISEAYETLSDAEKRAAYDNGEDMVDPSEMFGGGMAGGMGGLNPDILFSMMGGGAGGGRGGSGGNGGGFRPHPGNFSFHTGGQGGGGGFQFP